MGSKRRNALNILKGEKEILYYYMTLTDNTMALLEMDYDAFMIVTTEAQQVKDAYITTVLTKLMQENQNGSQSSDMKTCNSITCGHNEFLEILL